MSFFDLLPTSTWTFLTLNLAKNRHFWTTYPPLLVHVVIECPLPQGQSRTVTDVAVLAHGLLNIIIKKSVPCLTRPSKFEKPCLPASTYFFVQILLLELHWDTLVCKCLTKSNRKKCLPIKMESKQDKQIKSL